MFIESIAKVINILVQSKLSRMNIWNHRNFLHYKMCTTIKKANELSNNFKHSRSPHKSTKE